MISLYGATGFIGTHFWKKYVPTYKQNRDEIIPYGNEILFMASTVDNYNVFTDIEIDINTNEILPLRVLEEARKKFGTDFTFTYISSWFVYGDTDSPAKESAKCEPTGFYSITRLAGERLVRSYCETHKIPWKVIRLANIMGVGDKKASLKKNAVQFLISELVQGNKIKIYKEPSYRDFMDVRDCVRAIKMIMDSLRQNEIFNVGSGVSWNVRELLESVDHDNLIEYMDAPEFHKSVQVREFSLDVSKIKEMGFVPEFTLPETIYWIMKQYG